MASNKTDLCTGEQVKVVQAGGRGWEKLGDTVYEITEMNYEPTGYRCMIRKAGTAPNGKPYKAQEFDVDLLRRVK